MVNNDKKDAVVEDENTIADNTVVQKYKVAGNIVNSEYIRPWWRLRPGGESLPSGWFLRRYGRPEGVYFWDVAFSLALQRGLSGARARRGDGFARSHVFGSSGRFWIAGGRAIRMIFGIVLGKMRPKSARLFRHSKSVRNAIN